MNRKINCLFLLSTLASTACFGISNPAFAIINGAEVSAADEIARSVVALQMEEVQPDKSINYYHGTGIVIGERLLLTAGHNFYFLADKTSAHAILSVSPAWGSDPKGQKRIKVRAVSVYPYFKMDKNGTYNDLAVILLEDKFPSFYKPLTIATPEVAPPVLGEPAVVAGYGMSIAVAHPNLSDLRLRDATMQLGWLENAAFQNSPKFWFAGQGATIAGGDSGGPAIFQRGNRKYLFGIALHHLYDGQGNALPPCAFTNVVAYSGWIKTAEEELLRQTTQKPGF